MKKYNNVTIAAMLLAASVFTSNAGLSVKHLNLSNQQDSYLRTLWNNKGKISAAAIFTLGIIAKSYLNSTPKKPELGWKKEAPVPKLGWKKEAPVPKLGWKKETLKLAWTNPLKNLNPTQKSFVNFSNWLLGKK